MKIVVWIRPTGDDEKPTLRVDCKYESKDTPVIQRYGRKLMAALEGKGADK